MIKKNKYRLDVVKTLFRFAFGVKKFFLLMIIFNLLTVLCVFLIPIFYKMFIDDVIINGQYHKFIYILTGYISVFLINCIISYANLFSKNKFINRVIFRIKLKIFYGYFGRDFTDYYKQSIGDMKLRIDDDLEYLAEFPSIQVIDYFKSAVIVISAVVLMLLLDWKLLVFSLFAIPFTLFLDHVISLKEKKINELKRDCSQKVSSWIFKTIHGWREIKALNLQNHEIIKYIKFLRLEALYNAEWINYWTFRVLVIPRIKEEFLMKFLLYFVGGIFIISGNLTIGILIVFAQYYGILSATLQTLSKTDADFQSNMPIFDRILDEIKKSHKLIIPKSIPVNSNGNIIFKNVTFTYPLMEKAVLKNLNFTITTNERVAIIGKSGSGKTTILKLMTGMLNPTSGQVLFSDMNVTDICQNFLFTKIGFVTQENMLFNMSIKENLLLVKTDATDEELFDACKKACIYDFINSLPNGLNTVIGERGVKLSGGQRQRLILTRLFLHNPEIFIFDEATSGIDQYSENIIQDTIGKIGRNKTIIIVAHRKSSISICDRILRISNGEINEIANAESIYTNDEFTMK